VPQATIEWAYLLLGITLGGGLIVQRAQRDR
jgi:hypothetical protein